MSLKKLSIPVLVGIFILLISLSATSKAELVRFIATGDSRGNDNGVNTTILGEIAQATIDEGVDFILFTGDLVNGSSNPAMLESQLTTWRNTMQPLYDAGIGVYPCRGNHDKGSKAAWDNVFSGVYALPGNGPIGEANITFSLTHANVFIVGLDQYATHPKRVNQTWLDEQFALNTQPHVFIFGHEPAFSVYHLDCLDDYPSERAIFWKSIAAECGRIYFTGHDHLYNHARIDDGDGNADNDLHQYVVGTAGAPLYTWNSSYNGNNGSWAPQLVHNEKEYGYMLVGVNGFNVTLTWKHRIAPGLYEVGGDEFTYTFNDTDNDGIGDICDNCPNDYNLNQDDTLPSGGNGIGDACDCEADFNCDGNVDAMDVTDFLVDFGRSNFDNPCTDLNPCNGDFNCDTNVDAADVTKFLEDFGRSRFFNSCPACTQGTWCVYP